MTAFFLPVILSSMKPSASHKRIFLVNRDFQLRYAKAAVIVGILSTFMTAVLILYPLYVFKILVIPRFLPAPFLIAMAFAAVLNMTFIAAAGVVMTHRIAGPMYSMVRQMRRLSAGIFRSPISLRKNDDLRFLVRNYNDLVDGLVRLTESDVRQIQEIEVAIEHLVNSGAAAKDAEPKLIEVRQKVADLRLALGRRLDSYPPDFIPAEPLNGR